MYIFRKTPPQGIKYPKSADDPITFGELCALLTHLSKPLTRHEDLREAFHFFTQSDLITPEDLLAAYQVLGDETLSMRDARVLLGMGKEMSNEEKEELREHGGITFVCESPPARLQEEIHRGMTCTRRYNFSACRGFVVYAYVFHTAPQVPACRRRFEA